MKVAQRLAEKNIAALQHAMTRAPNATQIASTNRNNTMIFRLIIAINFFFYACLLNAATCEHKNFPEKNQSTLNVSQQTSILLYIEKLENEMHYLQKYYLSNKSDSVVLKIIKLHEQKETCLAQANNP